MIKINYFDERELLVRREIETKAPKDTEAKGTQVLPARITSRNSTTHLPHAFMTLNALLNFSPMRL